MKVFPYWKKASIISILAGAAWLAYAYFFIVAGDQLWYSFFLVIAGLASLETAIALYLRVRDVDEGWALIALVLGIAGALGIAIHGAYDLANAFNPPMEANLDLPSQIDPRGFLAFFVTGAALLKFSYLAWVGKKLPNNLLIVGLISGILTILIYIARLTVLSPTHPMLQYPVLIEGFLVNPLWYVWLGLVFRGRK
jgi:hypothetical protein